MSTNMTPGVSGNLAGNPAGTSTVFVAAEHTRAGVVSAIAARMADHEWAFQGEASAPSLWTEADDNGDLDVWVHADSQRAIDDVLRSLGGVLVGSALDPARLRHQQWWLPTMGACRDGAIVDVTIGDLRVGPLLLLPEHAVQTCTSACSLPTGAIAVRRFVGSAAVIDLALRPLLRGRLVEGHRLTAARIAYAVAVAEGDDLLGPFGHVEIRRALQHAVGLDGLVLGQMWLQGDPAVTDRAASLVGLARRRLIAATLRTPLATWRQRRSILPSRGARPLGFRSEGAVIALVGTDGSGKSTVADGLAQRLERAGFRVERRYFGMARGNARWLTALRSLAGGGSLEASPGTSSAGANHKPSLVMRLAAYAYAVDYVWRAWRTVRPARKQGAIVLCDRWITDLHRHPAPGSPAARLAERLVGRPQLFVLADAPVEQIVARKPERTLAEAAAEQDGLREIGNAMHGRRARGGGRTRFVVADTSGPRGSATTALTAVAVAAAHRSLV